MDTTGHDSVQSLGHITYSVQICIAQNPRMCGDGYLDNEGTRSGLAVSNAYPTHSQTFSSPPRTLECVATATLITKRPGLVWLCPMPTQHTHKPFPPLPPSACKYRQGGCSSLALSTTGPYCYAHMVTHSAQRQINASPLLTTIRHFTGSVYLFALIICLQWLSYLRADILSMGSKYDRVDLWANQLVRFEWTASNLIALVEFRIPPSQARLSVTHTYAHNHSHLSLPGRRMPDA